MQHRVGVEKHNVDTHHKNNNNNNNKLVSIFWKKQMKTFCFETE